QPGFPADDPAFVAWRQLVRGIQRSQVHFDLVVGAPENRRAAAGTEESTGVVSGFALDRYRLLREHRSRLKKSPMVLGAGEPVPQADPRRPARGQKSDVAEQAAAGEVVHAASPSEWVLASWSGRLMRPREARHRSATAPGRCFSFPMRGFRSSCRPRTGS